jgi:glycine cleavage system H protein
LADYEIPGELRYSSEDEWVRDEGELVRVGVTDYAQQQLGDVVFLELPEVGSRLQHGEAFGVIESVKAVSDLYAPISGPVVEVNEDLRDRPELVNEACYGDGWIVAVAPEDGTELASLLDAAAYRKHVAERE